MGRPLESVSPQPRAAQRLPAHGVAATVMLTASPSTAVKSNACTASSELLTVSPQRTARCIVARAGPPAIDAAAAARSARGRKRFIFRAKLYGARLARVKRRRGTCHSRRTGDANVSRGVLPCLDARRGAGASFEAPVLTGPPEAILAVLRSAQSGAPDPRLGDVLEAFRRHWMTIARKRYPRLRDDVEDAVQAALMKLVSADRLAHLKDPGRLEAWARSIFVHSVIDVAREGGRHRTGRIYLGEADEDPEQLLRERLPADRPGPEDVAAFHERLEIVRRCIQNLDVARLRFLEDVPEKEIAARQNLTLDAVAGQLKRIRRGLRIA